MTTIKSWTDNSLIQFFLEMFNFDFLGIPWLTERGIIMSKEIGVKFSANSSGRLMVISTICVAKPSYLLTISTSKGFIKIGVTKATYECMRAGDPLPVDVQESRFYPNRIRLRSIHKD